jgi:nitrogen regulatory protein P-II 1
MKKIEAIVPSEDMQGTFDALEEAGIYFSYCDIKGRGGTPRNAEERDMGSGRIKVSAEFSPGVLIMAVVDDSREEGVIDTLRKNANTNGKIFVSDLKDAIDIKSGQRGEAVTQ